MDDSNASRKRGDMLERLNLALAAAIERQWDHLTRFVIEATRLAFLLLQACVQFSFYLAPFIFAVFTGLFGFELVSRGLRAQLVTRIFLVICGGGLIISGAWYFVAMLQALLPRAKALSEPTEQQENLSSRRGLGHLSALLFVGLDVLCLLTVYFITSEGHNFRSTPLRFLQTQLASALSVGPAVISKEDAGYWPTIKSGEAASTDGQRVSLWAESVLIAEARTVVNIGAKAWDPNDEAELHQAKGAYLSDPSGRILRLIKDGGTYRRSLTNGFFMSPQHEVNGRKPYHFSLAFEPISAATSFIVLHHEQFAECRIMLRPDKQNEDVASKAASTPQLSNRKENLSTPPLNDVAPPGLHTVLPTVPVNDNDRKPSVEVKPPPIISRIQWNDRDPHVCDKPGNAFFAHYGPAMPQPAGSGGYPNPEYLFDSAHGDGTINWSNGFKGTVPVCFVVDEAGKTVVGQFEKRRT